MFSKGTVDSREVPRLLRVCQIHYNIVCYSTQLWLQILKFARMRQTFIMESYAVSTMSYAKCKKPKGRWNTTGSNSSLEERVRILESYHKDHYPCKYCTQTIGCVHVHHPLSSSVLFIHVSMDDKAIHHFFHG